jgi:hypothetical protein
MSDPVLADAEVEVEAGIEIEPTAMDEGDKQVEEDTAEAPLQVSSES